MAGGAWLEFNLFDDIAGSLPEKVGARCLVAALQVGAGAQELMSRPKHGRSYRIKSIKKTYAAGGKMAQKLKAAGFRGRFSERKGKSYKTFSVGARIHRASAPGEAPAIRTGHLTGSLSVDMTGPTQATVTFSAEYAAALEFGSAHVAPRPFVEPSVVAVKDAFFESIGKLLE